VRCPRGLARCRRGVRGRDHLKRLCARRRCGRSRPRLGGGPRHDHRSFLVWRRVGSPRRRRAPRATRWLRRRLHPLRGDPRLGGRVPRQPRADRCPRLRPNPSPLGDRGPRLVSGRPHNARHRSRHGIRNRAPPHHPALLGGAGRRGATRSERLGKCPRLRRRLRNPGDRRRTSRGAGRRGGRERQPRSRGDRPQCGAQCRRRPGSRVSHP